MCMKKRVALTIVLSVALTAVFAQAPAKKKNKDLKKQLSEMEKEDQKWRNAWTEAQVKGDSAAAAKADQETARVDSLNYYTLRDMFSKHGYPNYDLVGADGALYFWLLVQHQDKHPQFQDSVLTAMKKEVDRGKANATLYAYLTDRVRVNSGKPQLYGTQVVMKADSTTYEPLPVEDPERLDERRKSVGLEPIAAYIKSVNETYMKKPDH
jgi:hypothetical protein